MSSRPKRFNRLEGAQASASHPASQVWLSASAGTGKTHVLTARVLRLLLNGAAPESILCLTFTKAGAAEMAERVNARLASWVRMREQDLAKELFALDEAHDEDAVRAARRLFARVLDAPGGGLRIQTIHSFCQTLLAGFPAEAGTAPGFRPLDGRAEAALARGTLADLIARAEGQGDLGLIDDVQALSRRLGEDKAERYLLLAARAPDALAALGPREGIEARVRTALEVPLGDVEAAIEAACADEAFDCATLRQTIAANRAWGAKGGLEHAGMAEAFLAADARERAGMLDALIGIARTKAGDPRAFTAKLLGCDPAHGDNCAALAEAIDRLLGLRRRAGLAALLAAGLRAGQAYALAYQAAKRAAGAVDFDDLIRLTVALLERTGIGEWIRYKLDRRTDHVLVDEGQDTNPAQWRIVRALADEFFAEEEGSESRAVRTIFSVGDFKQAIFGFQGTDPFAFAAARAYFERAVEESGRRMERLSLDRSFRSAPAVLTVVDRLIAELGPARLGLDEDVPRHLSAREGLPGQVTLWQPVSGGSDPVSVHPEPVKGGASGEAPGTSASIAPGTNGEGAADGASGLDDTGEEGWLDDATRAFATRLARQVKAWLADPPWVAGKGRPLRPEDILILCRKRGSLAALIVARLHAEGVAVAGVDRLRLDAPLAVRDLIAAIRFVLQPRDDLTLASLLVSPLFGLTQDQLYTVAFRREGSLWEAVRSDPALSETAAGLLDLLNQADLTTPYRFLEHILSGPLDGRRRLMRRLGPEARDPIEELVNAALAFEGEATATLQRFLDWFDRDAVEIARDPSAPLDAVRVMTVHGAKGLQAPWVILADATGDPELSRASSIDWALEEGAAALPVLMPRKGELAGTLAEALAAAERREREEHWRLLYVAVTRAEERLVIGGALGPRCKGVAPAESWWQALATTLAGLGAEEVADPLWGARRDHIEAGRAAAVRARTRLSEMVIPPAPEWLRLPAPEEARPPRPLAPSTLGEDLVADPPPGPAMRAAARRGQLLHALFERLPALPPEQRAAAGARWLEHSAGFENAAERHALVAEVCGIVGDPAHAALFASEGLAEAPIAAVLPDGTVVAGTVDRLLVGEDRVRVVDFKTGRHVPAAIGDAPAHHLKQMAAYAAALAVIFPGRRIEAALLYTGGPILLPLPPEVLEQQKPGFAAKEQKLAPTG